MQGDEFSFSLDGFTQFMRNPMEPVKTAEQYFKENKPDEVTVASSGSFHLGLGGDFFFVHKADFTNCEHWV